MARRAKTKADLEKENDELYAKLEGVYDDLAGFLGVDEDDEEDDEEDDDAGDDD